LAEAEDEEAAMLVKEDLAELKDETYKDVKSEHNNQDAEPLAKRTI
jgi:hypothetical protein